MDSLPLIHLGSPQKELEGTNVFEYLQYKYINILSLFKKKCLFIFGCVGACELSLVVVSRGYFLVAVCGLLLAVASLVADHGL